MALGRRRSVLPTQRPEPGWWRRRWSDVRASPTRSRRHRGSMTAARSRRLAYLRAVANPADEGSVKRVRERRRKRGVGDSSVARVDAQAASQRRGLPAGAPAGGARPAWAPEPEAASKTSWRVPAPAAWADALDGGAGPWPPVERILDETGYRAELQAEDSIEAEGRLENLDRVGRAAADFEYADVYDVSFSRSGWVVRLRRHLRDQSSGAADDPSLAEGRIPRRVHGRHGRGRVSSPSLVRSSPTSSRRSGGWPTWASPAPSTPVPHQRLEPHTCGLHPVQPSQPVPPLEIPEELVEEQEHGPPWPGDSGSSWAAGRGRRRGRPCDSRWMTLMAWFSGARATIGERVVEAARPDWLSAPTGAEELGLRIGDDVVHSKWGEGVVIDLSGEGDKAEVTVRFPTVGEKRLLLAWSPLPGPERLGAAGVGSGPSSPAERRRRPEPGRRLGGSGARRRTTATTRESIGARQVPEPVDLDVGGVPGQAPGARRRMWATRAGRRRSRPRPSAPPTGGRRRPAG